MGASEPLEREEEMAPACEGCGDARPLGPDGHCVDCSPARSLVAKRAAELWAATELILPVLRGVTDYTNVVLACGESREVVEEYAKLAGIEVHLCRYADGGLIVTTLGSIENFLHPSVSTDRQEIAAATAFAIGLGQQADPTLLEDSVRVKLDALLEGRALPEAE